MREIWQTCLNEYTLAVRVGIVMWLVSKFTGKHIIEVMLYDSRVTFTLVEGGSHN